MKNVRPMVFAVLIGTGLIVAALLGCGQTARSQGVIAGAEVRLPRPRVTGPVSVEQALVQRRSVREFGAKDLTTGQISQLAWAAQGITERERGFRSAPSAGALYPLEVYFVKRDGVFRYVPEGHKLLQVSEQDLRSALSRAALGQAAVRAAPLNIVITAFYERTRVKYGARAQRYVHIETGHVGQNIHLQAVALGLVSVSIGAFEDQAVARLLGLASDETPLYIIPVGYRDQR